MNPIRLHHGHWTATLDLATANLTLQDHGRPLPWVVDLGRTAHIVVRPAGPGASQETHPLHLPALTHRQLAPNHHQWIGRIGDAGLAAEIELSDQGLAFTLSPTGEGEAELVAAAWPGQVRLPSPDRQVCWSNYTQGALFRADGRPWSAEISWDHVSMRLVGLTCGNDSLALITETPEDASARLADDGQSELSCAVTFGPSLGTLAYPRRLLLVPLSPGGHVAIANRFRAWLQANQLWKPWEQRVEENPQVARLQGAFIACAGYYHDDGADQLGVMRAMRQYGFERGYLFCPKTFMFDAGCWMPGAQINDVSDEDIRQIQDFGYLCAPFLQVEEATPVIGQRLFAADANGQKVQRWQIGDSRFYEIAKWRVPGMLARLAEHLQSSHAMHFDTLTAMPLIEHWGHRQYDRRDDARLRLQIARHFRRQGKLIAAEGLRDWATLDVDLSSSKATTPVVPADPRIWHLPLTDLVYHDSVMRSHWEHSPYDDIHGAGSMLERHYFPFGNHLMDLLTAAPPVLFPEGKLYAYQRQVVALPDGRQELHIHRDRPAQFYHKRFIDPATQAALPLALRVCQLNQRHGVARMIAHRFVEAGNPLVQESEFSTGLHVVVNFGDEPYPLPGGRTVPGRSSLVDE